MTQNTVAITEERSELAPPQTYEEQQARERHNPLCLRAGDPQGEALIDEAIGVFGTATTIELRLKMSIGHLNRFRNERYMTFNLVDSLLLLLDEPWRIDDYDFRYRTEWEREYGPSPATIKRKGYARSPKKPKSLLKSTPA
jgi:hypothetical protein